MGFFIFSTMSSNSRTTQKNELSKLIKSEEKQLHTGLSLLTSSSLAADAFFGLEADDDVLAVEIGKHVKAMGLDILVFTDLEGKVLYPQEGKLPDGLEPVLAQNTPKSGFTRVLAINKQMVGYGPIFDVETPKGYLLFVINLPVGIAEIAHKVINIETSAGETGDPSKDTKISTHLQKLKIESETQSETFLKKMIYMIGGIMLAGIFATVIIFGLLARSISKPINRIIAGLTQGADQVSSASGQVSSASQLLAEGASEQAASIEETSSSLEEMSSMTKQNADNANQADGLMKGANQVVGQANDSMGELTTSMGEISKASEETSKIIKTIDEIAFQTNLLALNAAVEAARAGEAGAGFAVVADEVRNLALRAADAAKNTADLIEGTVKKVEDGSELVTKTNEAFTQVAESASKVGELVGEIAAASNEQAQGIDQVNNAVNEMDRVTQQNAASADESASASKGMNSQAEQMKDMVGELVVLVGATAEEKHLGSGPSQEQIGDPAEGGRSEPETCHPTGC